MKSIHLLALHIFVLLFVIIMLVQVCIFCESLQSKYEIALTYIDVKKVVKTLEIRKEFKSLSSKEYMEKEFKAKDKLIEQLN